MPKTSENLPIGEGVIIGPAPGSYEGQGLFPDLTALRQRGIRQLICLIEDEEFQHLDEDCTASSFLAACDQSHLEVLRLPIEDFEAPQLSDVVAAEALVGNANSVVYIHCMAGLGRAGTVAAALLIRGGMPAEDAILLVRWARPGAIQSSEQEDFLRKLGAL